MTWRRWANNLDLQLIFYASLLIFWGLMTLYTLNYKDSNPDGFTLPPYFLKQLIWVGLGLLLLGITVAIDYRTWAEMAYLFYIFTATALSLLLLLHLEKKGVQRWFSFGFINFQPSEMMKVAMVLTLSRYIADVNEKITHNRYILGAVALTALPCLLILLQPNLGTALLLPPLLLALLFMGGAPNGPLKVIVIGGLCLLPLGYLHLEDYQKDRLLSFLLPHRDPQGTGYQLIQSKIAIGSGMVLGHGWLKGTQGRLNYLPEKNTDFIFSCLSEEWGFFGSMFLLILFSLICLRGLDIAYKAKDFLGSLMAIGCITIIALQAFVNLGITMGLLPVAGLPLPFVSYGGSSLMATMFLLGMLLNIHMRSHVF